MNTVLIGVCGILAGIVFSLLVCLFKKAKSGDRSERKLTIKKVTKFILVSTQISALIWVYTSYAIAIYSTIVLHQVYTMAELSEPAINTLLGVGVIKLVENVFEHNSGGIFGKSDGENSG